MSANSVATRWFREIRISNASVRSVESSTGPRDRMPTHEEQILSILSEAAEPLFASEIAERLNLQLRPAVAYTTIEVGRALQGLHELAVLLADGRWMLKRLLH